jgi:hypothetical protein
MHLDTPLCVAAIVRAASQGIQVAILPFRTMMSSTPVYAGISPFGPKPHARSGELCRT